MLNIDMTDQVTLIAFWLCFVHWLVVLSQLPLFDNASIPNNVKVLGSLVIAYAFFDQTSKYVIEEIRYIGDNAFWMLTIYHSLVGLLVGFIAKMTLHLFTMTGAIMSQQMGFRAMTFFDPTISGRVGPMERLIRVMMIVIILYSGALLPMFKGIFITFNSLSIFNVESLFTAPQFFTEFFRSLFLSAFLLAIPILFTNVLMTMVMGLIARSIPQMNIIMVSFVVNIGSGLLVFFLIFTEFFNSAFKIYTELLGQWFNYII